MLVDQLLPDANSCAQWRASDNQSLHGPMADGKLLCDEVHVWRAPLNLSVSCIRRLKKTLSHDELCRAKQFYFEKDRQHFIVARGLLRVILSRYLGQQPEQLRFRYTQYRKPFLDVQFDQDLCFNLSHSHELVLLAVTRCRRVGIDLEYIRPLVDAEEIARRYFSEPEYAVFHSLPASLKQNAFFACWTRKEAYVKAKGKGLSLELDMFDVSVAPDQPAAILKIQGDRKETSQWSLKDLNVGNGYVGTLAVEGLDWRLQCWHYHSNGDSYVHRYKSGLPPSIRESRR